MPRWPTGGYDAILLDLHGAMVAEGFEDGEGELLRRIRAIDAMTPIGVAYDMHANVYGSMIETATIVAGYHTYPHIDQAETAERAARVLLRALTWRGQAGRRLGPRADAAACHGAGHACLPEQGAAGDVPRLGGKRPGAGRQPLRRFPACGYPRARAFRRWSSPMATRRMRSAWCRSCWTLPGRRVSNFVFLPEPLADSVARAKAAGATKADKPVVLLDHYDNCASGGTMDTTEVLAEILRQGLTDVAFFGICDPAAVAAMPGGRRGCDGDALARWQAADAGAAAAARPIEVTGIVRTISAGYFVTKEGLSPGLRVFMGPTVVLDTGAVEIVLVTPADRAGLARHVPRAGHRAARQAVPGDQEPSALARGARPAGAGDRGVRRRRRLHLGLFAAHFPQRAAADLPARSRNRRPDRVAACARGPGWPP